jgi:hypothetical protein
MKTRFLWLMFPAAVILALAGCSSGSSDHFDIVPDPTGDGEPDEGDIVSDMPEGDFVCSPGARECVGAASYRECQPDGSGWGGEQACAGGETCYEGVCLDPCEHARSTRSSIGCLFYALDMDQWSWPVQEYDTSPYAIVTSNIDDTFAATVSVEQKSGGVWTTVESTVIPANSLYTFRMPGDSHVEDTDLVPGVAYRVVSDFPIIAYQFNPIDTADQATNDASTLLPLHTLDRYYVAASWHQFGAEVLNRDSKGYVSIVGTQDGTTVTVRPTAVVKAGGPIPEIPAGGSHEVVLNDGDVFQIATLTSDADLSGTYIEASAAVAVFGGHECADVPYHCDWCRDGFGYPPGGSEPEHEENTCAWCDHLEEQIFPLTTWGKSFVASRIPMRSTGDVTEAAFWRVIASEPNTTVTVVERAGITVRFPSGTVNPVTLQDGEYVDFEMVGSPSDPGDCIVDADQPVLLVQYIEGQECTNLTQEEGGDPAMICMVPVEQFLDEYIFLTPMTYDVDFVVVTRPAGSQVTLDGLPMADGLFIPVGSEWEVGRTEIADGVHRITGTEPFGIVAVGYSPWVSYGYPGGMNLEVINPII